MTRWAAVGTPGQAPVIRVRQMHENLGAIDCFEVPTQAEIRARLGDTVALIEGAPSSSWFPIELDVEVAEIIGKTCGIDGLRRWARRGLERGFGAPCLKGIVRGAVGMFGLEPANVLRFVPRGIENIYRNCGSWEAVSTDEGFVDLRWDDAPSVVARSAMCTESFAGALEAVLDALDRTGTVTLGEDGDTLVFEMRWT